MGQRTSGGRSKRLTEGEEGRGETGSDFVLSGECTDGEERVRVVQEATPS